MPSTVPLACGLNVVSTVPSVSSRPREFCGLPPNEVKAPPTSIMPSACTAKQYTVLLAPGLKAVSRLPSALTRPMRLRACPPNVVKLPPSKILPSACTAKQDTVLFPPGLKASAVGDWAWQRSVAARKVIDRPSLLECKRT